VCGGAQGAFTACMGGGLREDVRVGFPGDQVLTPTRGGVAFDPPSSRAGMRRPAGRSDEQMWECECVIIDRQKFKRNAFF